MKLLVFISTKDSELYERQIAKEAKVSVGAVNKIMKEFAKLGLVKKIRKGRMLFYSRNDESPLLRQFKVFITVNNLMPVIEKIAHSVNASFSSGAVSKVETGRKAIWIYSFFRKRKKQYGGFLMATQKYRQ